MTKFILKDQRGNEQEFDHDKIFVMGADGELLQFTQGEGDTPAVVQPLEVTENGTYTAPDGVDGFNQVEVNVDPTWKNILVKDEIGGFALDSTFGAFSPGYVYPAAFALEVGKTYKVSWDGEIFDDRVAFAIPIDPNQQIIAIGNASSLGLQGNNEPFLILHNQTYDNTQLFSTDTDESHTVGIWEKVAATSNDVRYVTFKSYDGLTEYGKKAVAVGDDCADPIARGIFTTPTRESDAQYNYTFYGWATTPGGGADANWNKAITEDKTVYANFASTVRKYTITYYDSDGTTVLKTESLAYGSTPSYAPTKEDHLFSGWSPNVETVVGDASYVAVWEEKVTFESASWEKIVSIAESGNASQVFKVGDTKPFTITYADGTTEENAFIIADFNKGTANDGTTANIVLVSAYALKTTRQIHNKTSGSIYTSSNLDTFLKNDLLNALPQEIQAAAKNVRLAKYSNTYRKCALLALEELGLNKPDFTLNGGEYSLALFSSDASRVRTLGGNGSATTYFTRNSRSASGMYSYAYITETGKVYGEGSNAGYASALDYRGIVFKIHI
jgi:hypothetical protein